MTPLKASSELRELTGIPLEVMLIYLGHRFRDLSYHSDGRWIARSGANTGRFMTSARTPQEALLKLIKKLEKEPGTQTIRELKNE